MQNVLGELQYQLQSFMCYVQLPLSSSGRCWLGITSHVVTLGLDVWHSTPSHAWLSVAMARCEYAQQPELSSASKLVNARAVFGLVCDLKRRGWVVVKRCTAPRCTLPDPRVARVQERNANFV